MLPSVWGGRQPKPPRDLDRIYAMPNENRSLDDYHRARHLDLPRLDDLDLVLEERCVLARLAYDGDWGRRAWLIERRGAIQHERRRRRSTSTRSPGLFAPPYPHPERADVGRPVVPVRGGGRRGR